MTRKGMGAFLCGLAVGIVALLPKLNMMALASPTKSLIGGHSVEINGNESSTAINYVRNGLVHMWDGIENIGWGCHDNNSDIWVDLIGTLDATLVGNAHFSDICLDCDSSSWATIDKNALWTTIEIVARIKGASGNYQRMLFSGKLGNWENTKYNITIYAAFSSKAPYWYLNMVRYQYPGCNLYSVIGNPPMSSPATLSFGEISYANGIEIPTWDPAKSAYMSSSRGINVPQYNSTSTYPIEYYCIRLYNRQLTEEEVLYNHQVDCERFGLER